MPRSTSVSTRSTSPFDFEIFSPPRSRNSLCTHDADPRVHAERALALGHLVGVVDAHVVDAAGVDVEAVAEVLRGHGRALDVPAGEAAPPRRVPLLLALHARAASASRARSRRGGAWPRRARPGRSWPARRGRGRRSRRSGGTSTRRSRRRRRSRRCGRAPRASGSCAICSAMCDAALGTTSGSRQPRRRAVVGPLLRVVGGDLRGGLPGWPPPPSPSCRRPRRRRTRGGRRR